MSTEVSTQHLLADLKQVLSCPMCRKILEDPAIITSCQHCFCFGCINLGIERGSVPCDIPWDPVVRKRRRASSKKVTFQCPACGQAAYKWMLQRVPTLSTFLNRVRDTMERISLPAEVGATSEQNNLVYSGSGDAPPSPPMSPVEGGDDAENPNCFSRQPAQDRSQANGGNLSSPSPIAQATGNLIAGPPIPESVASSVLLFEESCNLWPVDGDTSTIGEVVVVDQSVTAPSSSSLAIATTLTTASLTRTSTVELAAPCRSTVAPVGLHPHPGHSGPAEGHESLVGFVRTPPAVVTDAANSAPSLHHGDDNHSMELAREASSHVTLPAAPCRLTESVPKASPIRVVPTLVSIDVDGSVWNCDGGAVARNKYEQLLTLASRRLNGTLLQTNILSRMCEALDSAAPHPCLRVDVRHASHCVCLLDHEMFATRSTAAQCDVLLTRAHYHLDVLIVGLQWAVSCIELGHWLSPIESARFACKSHAVQRQAMLGVAVGFDGAPGAASNLPFRAITFVVHARVANLKSLLDPDQEVARREVASVARLALRFGADQVWLHVDGEDDGESQWVQALPFVDDSPSNDLVKSLFADEHSDVAQSAALFVVSVVSKSVKDGASRITPLHPGAPLLFRQRLQAKHTHVVRRSAQWLYDRITQDPVGFMALCSSMRSGEVCEWENQRPRGSARSLLLGEH